MSTVDQNIQNATNDDQLADKVKTDLAPLMAELQANKEEFEAATKATLKALDEIDETLNKAGEKIDTLTKELDEIEEDAAEMLDLLNIEIAEDIASDPEALKAFEEATKDAK